jgi:hypothetical protein
MNKKDVNDFNDRSVGFFKKVKFPVNFSENCWFWLYGKGYA